MPPTRRTDPGSRQTRLAVGARRSGVGAEVVSDVRSGAGRAQVARPRRVVTTVRLRAATVHRGC
jgi:hypothetical protein